MERHSDPRAIRRARALAVFAVLIPFCLGSLCEGDGSSRPGVISQGPIHPSCTPIGGPFPSGFDLLSGTTDRAVAMRFIPAGLLRFDLSTIPPAPDNRAPVPGLPADTDGDGQIDAVAFQAAGLCPPRLPECQAAPKVGGVNSAFPDLALVTASGYEEVLFYDSATGGLTLIEVRSPTDSVSDRAADRPLWPPAGTSALRTAISTMVCAYEPGAIDSSGNAIVASPLCDPARVGFLTRFTAATAVSGDRLFVVTSNLFSPSRALFHPGTVLVHTLEFTADGNPVRIQPDSTTPILFTTAFNPTGITAHRTPGGHDLVLVTNTGALDAGGRLLTDSSIDIIDATAVRIVATVPLGRAGAAFGRLAIDPGGLVALLGAESSRSLYAIDLSGLDDPALYAPRTEPVVLDGSTPGFADARIFHADAPLRLPPRPDGPSPAACATRTNVTLNHDGRLAYATDWCDGAIHIISIDWTLPLEQPISASRFRVDRRLDLFAPKTAANFGLPAAPSLPRTRSGEPGRDFDGADLFFIINEPEGQLCAARVEF